MATSYSQTAKLTLDVKNETISQIIEKIEKQSEYTFVYNVNEVDLNKRVDISAQNVSLEYILDKIFANQSVDYVLTDRHVALYHRQSQLQKGTLISGTVVDKEGLPIIGANIVEKETTNGTISDMNGAFSITVAPAAVLLVTYIGYVSQEMRIGSNTSLSLVLKDDSEMLNEVVVVGYGTQKKVNLTGSVSTIQGERLDKRIVSQTSQALQGLAPGLTVIQASGQPGTTSSIKIRGIGTLGNSSPLILIDGIEGDINNVNPSDIENISVLKDAASAAIYGSRASNGVILVTTKRAISNKISVDFRANVGFQSFTDLPKFLGGLDYLKMRNEANINEGKGTFYSDEYVKNYIANSSSDQYPETDWQKETYTNSGLQQSYTASLNGGTDKSRILASLNYLNQEGKVENTGFEKYGLRINTDIVPIANLKISLDVNGTFSDVKEPGVGVSRIFYETNRTPPIYAAYYENRTRLAEGNLGNNSVALANSSGEMSRFYTDLSFNAKVEYEIIRGLKASAVFSPQLGYISEKTFTKKCEMRDWTGNSSFYTPNETALKQGNTKMFNMNIKALLNYDKTIGDHSFVALLGYEQIYYSNGWFDAYRENFTLSDYSELNAGSVENQQANGTGYEWALRSYFGRINYNYKGKYLLEANVRYDGSSRFSQSNRYGTFPSFSAGWRLSEESFMKNISWLSNLKLIASWGMLGNQDIGNYPYLSVIALGQNNVFEKMSANGAAQLIYANNNISWESTKVVNAGIDFSLFNNKLTGLFEYYVKNTDDILLKLPIPMTTGLSASEQNAGKVRNTGWDLTLGYRDNWGDWGLGITCMLSDVKNEVLSLKDGGPFYGSYTITKEGYPINSLYGYVAEGLFQSKEEVEQYSKQFGVVGPGDIKYKDVDDNGVISASGDREVIGQTIPRYTYSGMVDVNYKNFDLTILLQGIGKVDGYMDADAVMAFFNGAKVSDYHLDRWTPDNPGASYPRLTISYPNNQQISSYWLRSAAYLRLKNIQIGYKLPENVLKKTFLNYVRFYFSGDNLLTFDSFYNGWDAEAPLGNGAFYPQIKMISFGVDVKF